MWFKKNEIPFFFPLGPIIILENDKNIIDLNGDFTFRFLGAAGATDAVFC